MKISLNKNYNGVGLKTLAGVLNFINQNGSVGFNVVSDNAYGVNIVVDNNRGIESDIYTVFKNFVAKVMGRYILINDSKERSKYPEDFIIFDNDKGITRINLRAYDEQKEAMGLSISYDKINDQIRIDAESNKAYNNYMLLNSKDYYGKCVLEFKELVDNLNKVYFKSVNIEEPKTEEEKEIPFKDFLVKVTAQDKGDLLNGVVLKKANQEMQIIEDNGGDIHISSLDKQFALYADYSDKNLIKAFHIFEETMQLIFGNMVLAEERGSDISKFINIQAKRIKLLTDGYNKTDNLTMTYDNDQIIFDFDKSKQDLNKYYHVIVAMSGSKYGIVSKLLKEMLFKLMDEFDREEEKKDLNKDSNVLGRRR